MMRFRKKILNSFCIIIIVILAFLCIQKTYASSKQSVLQTTFAKKNLTMNKIALKGATDIALYAMQHGFSDYERHMRGISIYFTEEGTKKYEEAMISSGTKKAWVDGNLKKEATLRSEPDIFLKNEKDGRIVWFIEIPINIHDKTLNHTQNNQNVMIEFIHDDTIKNPQGVNRFFVYDDSIKKDIHDIILSEQ